MEFIRVAEILERLRVPFSVEFGLGRKYYEIIVGLPNCELSIKPEDSKMILVRKVNGNVAPTKTYTVDGKGVEEFLVKHLSEELDFPFKLCMETLKINDFADIMGRNPDLRAVVEYDDKLTAEVYLKEIDEESLISKVTLE